MCEISCPFVSHVNKRTFAEKSTPNIWCLVSFTLGFRCLKNVKFLYYYSYLGLVIFFCAKIFVSIAPIKSVKSFSESTQRMRRFYCQVKTRRSLTEICQNFLYTRRNLKYRKFGIGFCLIYLDPLWKRENLPSLNFKTFFFYSDDFSLLSRMEIMENLLEQFSFLFLF